MEQLGNYYERLSNKQSSPEFTIRFCLFPNFDDDSNSDAVENFPLVCIDRPNVNLSIGGDTTNLTEPCKSIMAKKSEGNVLNRASWK